MADLLPRLFFQHFQYTSFAAVEDGAEQKLVGFLVGFVSQTDPSVSYIHFVGVHPDYRRQGVAKQLYEMFIVEARRRGCRQARCITSPSNVGSIAFHRTMGFRLEEGSSDESGVPVTLNYDGRGHARVRFVKDLTVP